VQDGTFTVSREDWSLHRQGHLDQQRHREKVLEAIRHNLADLVAEESIILAGGETVIKVPIRSLEEYRFRYDWEGRNHVGQGDGKSRVGQSLGPVRPASGPATGQRAGDQPGVDYYEADITVDELAELVFADLGLPHLDQKPTPELQQEAFAFRDVRRHGITGNLDRRRTLLAALKRAQQARGDPAAPVAITREDLRFKTWEEEWQEQASAVVLAMMDTSASMGTFEKYVARSFFFWMVRFLRTRYARVHIRFLAHDTRAREVTEQEFFSKGESGGTRCSSVYELALAILRADYPPDQYNVYAFHFSDGDNLPADNGRCLELVHALLDYPAAVGYGEIAARGSPHGARLGSVYEQLDHPRFTAVTIREKQDVYPALQAFFGPAAPGPAQGQGAAAHG